MEKILNRKIKSITPQSKASLQNRRIRYYTKYCRSNLGLSKTRLAHLIELTKNICKRDLIIVLRKIKFNESFEKLGNLFSIRASTAFYIFKRRVPQLAGQLGLLIDWHDDEIYKLYNPEGAPVHLKSMIDHLVVDRKRKYLISCTLFGLINFVSCGYPLKMANQKMIEQTNFVYELPPSADVMGPRKYKFLDRILQNESYFLLWESFPQNLKINNCEVIQMNKFAERPMITQVKHELRRFRILSDSDLDPKLSRLTDNIVIICAALCNLRKNWWRFCKMSGVLQDQEIEISCTDDEVVIVSEEEADVIEVSEEEEEEDVDFDVNNELLLRGQDDINSQKNLRSFFITF